MSDYIDIDSRLNYESEYKRFLSSNKLKISKGKIQSLCPFHDDKDPSFSVDLKKGAYKCFSCGANGNYVTFRSEIQHISTEDAYKKILDEIGIEPEKKQPEKPVKYSVQDYAKEKHLTVEYLQKYWKLEDFRDGIKIPYYDDQKELKATRYRKAGKQFTWAKNPTIIPYGLDKISYIKEKGFVILVEGESDTQSLWLHKVPTLGIAGASIFKEEWTEYLKGLKIFIHHEGDAGANTFEKKVCDALINQNFEGDVYKISCRLAGVKDPSDLHIKYKENFDQKWQEVLQKAEKLDLINIPELIKGCPIRLREPAGWIIKESGIFKIDEKNNREIRVIKSPLVITSRIHSLDSGEEKIEIAYLRDHRWKTAIFPRSVILFAKSIGVLSDLGIMINSENARDVVRFLADLESENDDLINVENSVSQLGWYDDLFLPCDQDKLKLDIHYTTQRYVDAYNSQGNLENWVENMKTYREENYIFRFLMASSFATPLLKHLNHRTFFLHNWADSRSGKTACLRASLSVWGNPEDLATSFNATKVGLERIAGFYNDLPLGIDEKQVIGNKNQDFIESMVYMLGLGGSKLRGNKNGGLQSQKSWRSIIMTTGEEPLSNMASQSGIGTRVLEIYGSPFNSEAKARAIYTLTQKNYGTAGNEFIKQLLSNYKGKFHELQDQHTAIVKDLEKEMRTNLSTHISAVAMIVLADILVGEWIFGKKDEATAYITGLQILANLETNEETDIIEKAYDYFKSWCWANRNAFDNYAKPSYGFIQKGSPTIFLIHPPILEAEMQKQNFHYKKILKGFSERGYIKQNEKSAGYQYQCRQNGERIRYIAIKMLDKTEENEQDQGKVVLLKPTAEIPAKIEKDDDDVKQLDLDNLVQELEEFAETE